MSRKCPLIKQCKNYDEISHTCQYYWYKKEYASCYKEINQEKLLNWIDYTALILYIFIQIIGFIILEPLVFGFNVISSTILLMVITGFNTKYR